MSENWGHEEVEVTEASIKQIDEICLQYTKIRDEIESLKEAIKKHDEDLTRYEQKIIEFLQTTGRPNWEGGFGKISLKTLKQVRQPQTREDKLKLFAYLQEQGLFEGMVSVNARTLTSWASKEIEAKEKQGQFGWVPPGLEQPTEYATLSLKRK